MADLPWAWALPPVLSPPLPSPCPFAGYSCGDEASSALAGTQLWPARPFLQQHTAGHPSTPAQQHTPFRSQLARAMCPPVTLSMTTHPAPDGCPLIHYLPCSSAMTACQCSSPSLHSAHKGPCECCASASTISSCETHTTSSSALCTLAETCPYPPPEPQHLSSPLCPWAGLLRGTYLSRYRQCSHRINPPSTC